jgi:hypothetical protein
MGREARLASASWNDHESVPSVPMPRAAGKRRGRVLLQIWWTSVPIWSFSFLSFVPFLAFAVIQRRKGDWAVFAGYLLVWGGGGVRRRGMPGGQRQLPCPCHPAAPRPGPGGWSWPSRLGVPPPQARPRQSRPARKYQLAAKYQPCPRLGMLKPVQERGSVRAAEARARIPSETRMVGAVVTGHDVPQHTCREPCV